MKHMRQRLLMTMVCGVLLLLPGTGLTHPASPGGGECVPNELDGTCLTLATPGNRVDTAPPVFSDPTRIDNPLFPISETGSALLMGTVDALPFRVEVTLMPTTKTIAWNGQRVETVVSQYTAYLDGRILEVALDWYAQADDGSVWYFGEDVFNYEDGVVADSHGAWIAGRDGPAGMIMPADPQVGDVYRPENIPGLVFEEVTVKATGESVDGPMGPVHHAIVVTELHADGGLEDKTFAAGYGEFLTASDGDLEALALAVPRDGLSSPLPADLEALVSGSMAVGDDVRAGAWERAATTVATMHEALNRYSAAGVPPWLDARMTTALAGLDEAVASANANEARQAALDVNQAALDLELRYLPATHIDLARFELWARQVTADAMANDLPALAGDVATMEWIWDRIAHTTDASTARDIAEQLAALRVAVDAEDLSTMMSVVADLHAFVQQVDPR